MQRALPQVIIVTHDPLGAKLQGEWMFAASSSQVATCIVQLHKIWNAPTEPYEPYEAEIKDTLLNIYVHSSFLQLQIKAESLHPSTTSSD